MHGTVVNDTPKFLLHDTSDDDHCVILKNENLEKYLRIPLTIHGVSSVLTSQRTTPKEYKHCENFIATSNAPLWDPHDALFGTQEAATTNSAGWSHEQEDAFDNRFITNVGLMGLNTLIP